MSNVYDLSEHQPQDLSERQAARQIGVDLKTFRAAQSARIMPPAIRRDEAGHGYWSRESIRAVVVFFAKMERGRDTQRVPKH